MAPLFTGKAFGFGRSAADGPIPFSASGGTVSTPGDGYKYHLFLSPNNFETSGTGNQIEYLVLAGGGGGGNGGDGFGGSGGAGGLVYGIVPSLAPGNYSLSVGSAGPAGGTGGNSILNIPSPTSPQILAAGGGAGGSRQSPWGEVPGPFGPNGSSGGSGGGGGSYGTSWPGTQPSQNPGNPYVIVQYGHPSGGSANASNSASVNATFPNGSTILSGSPIGGNNIGRGGPSTKNGLVPVPATSYGSGGAGDGSSSGPGVSGVIIIRYLI